MSEIIDLDIARWLVKELPDKSRHLVGLTYGEGRVSSKIVAFDKDTMTFTTRTGRKYLARRGGSAFNIAAAYLFETWCAINNVTDDEVVDVTKEYDPEELNEEII